MHAMGGVDRLVFEHTLLHDPLGKRENFRAASLEKSRHIERGELGFAGIPRCGDTGNRECRRRKSCLGKECAATAVAGYQILIHHECG